MRGVDTGAVFKHPVQCFGCDAAFYFSLRKIAESKALACPQCGSEINLVASTYASVVTEARQAVALIDDVQNLLQDSRARERVVNLRGPSTRVPHHRL